jgi:hypothetical protein
VFVTQGGFLDFPVDLGHHHTTITFTATNR